MRANQRNELEGLRLQTGNQHREMEAGDGWEKGPFKYMKQCKREARAKVTLRPVPKEVFVLGVPQTPRSLGKRSVFLAGLATGSLVLTSEHPGSLWGVDLRKGRVWLIFGAKVS